MTTAIIRMYAHEPVCLTPEEYEALRREVVARVLADDAGLAEQILARMLRDNEPRYHEAKRQNGGSP